MSKKPGLPMEWHRNTGAYLSGVHRRITRLALEVGNAYPLNNKAARAMRKVDRLLAEVRSELENNMGKEHEVRDRTDFLSIYYGSPANGE